MQTRITVPIIGIQPGNAKVLLIPNVAALPGAGLTLTMGNFDILAGEGPNPALAPGAEADPLPNAGRVSADVMSTTPAFTMDVNNVDPSDAPFTPTITRMGGGTVAVNNIWAGQVAATPSDIVFDCTGCPSATAYAVILTSTTATIPPGDTTSMPVDKAAGGTWISTTCAGNIQIPGSTTSITLPAAEVAKHLGNTKGITRTRVTVSRFGTDLANALMDKRVLAGHGYVGFSAPPASTKPSN